MKTCPNHPTIAFTDDECPTCAAEQAATLSESTIRMILDALDVVRDLLTEAGISLPRDGEDTKAAPESTTIAKPDTREDAFALLGKLGKRDLNNAHREITGESVKRGTEPGPVITRIVEAWFPVTPPGGKIPTEELAPAPEADEKTPPPAADRFAELSAIAASAGRYFAA